MEIKTFVNVGEVEVSVYVDTEKIAAALAGDTECRATISSGLNNTIHFLRAISDDQIKEFSIEARAVVVKAFSDQIERWKA